MTENNQIVVIGAGAAGMMAAGRAAECGANVLVLDKSKRPGEKIIISGNGRCNLTNARDLDSFIEQFGLNGRFLYSAFNRFFRDDLIALMERFGTKCRFSTTGKVYPLSDNSKDVVRALKNYLDEGKVTVRQGVNVTGVTIKDGKAIAVQTADGEIPASAVIMAAGGSSHPQTGSDGSGYRMAAALGHTIIKLRPGLVPLVVTDIPKAKLMQGASLRSARVTAFQCPADKIDISLIPGTDTGTRSSGKRAKPPVIQTRTGDAIITHFGLSGPVMLEMSLGIVDALENGPVSVSIDQHPGKDKAALRTELQQMFDKHSNQICQNALRRFTPPKLVDPFLEIAGVAPDKLCNQINAEERENLLNILKSLRFDVKGPYNMDTAMVTAGGVALKEVDPRTMASKMVEGLYLAGEILDLDAGTGGYNLQSAFSTGYVAGESAAAALGQG